MCDCSFLTGISMRAIQVTASDIRYSSLTAAQSVVAFLNKTYTCLAHVNSSKSHDDAFRQRINTSLENYSQQLAAMNTQMDVLHSENVRLKSQLSAMQAVAATAPAPLPLTTPFTAGSGAITTATQLHNSGGRSGAGRSAAINRSIGSGPLPIPSENASSKTAASGGSGGYSRHDNHRSSAAPPVPAPGEDALTKEYDTGRVLNAVHQLVPTEPAVFEYWSNVGTARTAGAAGASAAATMYGAAPQSLPSHLSHLSNRSPAASPNRSSPPRVAQRSRPTIGISAATAPVPGLTSTAYQSAPLSPPSANTTPKQAPPPPKPYTAASLSQPLTTTAPASARRQFLPTHAWPTTPNTAISPPAPARSADPAYGDDQVAIEDVNGDDGDDGGDGGAPISDEQLLAKFESGVLEADAWIASQEQLAAKVTAAAAANRAAQAPAPAKPPYQSSY